MDTPYIDALQNAGIAIAPVPQPTQLENAPALLQAANVDKFKETLTENSDRAAKSLLEYNPKKHKINQRLDKFIVKGGQTETYIDDEGSEREKVTEGKSFDTIKQWKVPIPYQKKIVQAGTAFLFAEPVKLESATQGPAFDRFIEIWNGMRMDTLNREVAEYTFSETECVKLFEPYKTSTGQAALACIPLAYSLGDTLYTQFNAYRQLTAFARGYKTKDFNTATEIEHLDVYYADAIYQCQRPAGAGGGDWRITPRTNLIGKIPISYYSQPYSEWDDVQGIIERLEWLVSTRADSNDYSGDPILVLTGSVSGLPGKYDSGKAVQLDTGGKAEYLSPSMGNDAVNSEYEKLRDLIHYCTDTPDLSTKELASLGQDSGKALEMRFFPATLKAKHKRGLFGEMLDREISIIRAYMDKVERAEGATDMQVSVKFNSPLPDQTADYINMLLSATGDKAVMSQETAVNLNPLVTDKEEEIKKIQNEQTTNGGNNEGGNGGINTQTSQETGKNAIQ